jgi:hypothetical protein
VSIAAEGYLIRGKASGRRGLRPERRMAPALGQEPGPLSLVVLGGTSTKTTYHGEQDFEPIPWFVCVIPSDSYSGSKPSGNSGRLSSPARLHVGQGMPGAPQPHSLGPSHG